MATSQIVQNQQTSKARKARKPIVDAWRKWDGFRRQALTTGKTYLIAKYDPWPNKTLPEPEAAAILAAAAALGDALKE